MSSSSTSTITWKWYPSQADGQRTIGGGRSGPNQRARTRLTERGDSSIDRLDSVSPEARFLYRMAEHHRRTMRASQVMFGCTRRASLADFCEDLIAIQSAELKTMVGWLRDWYGLEFSSHGFASYEVDRLLTLQTDQRDRVFLEMILRDDRQAICEGRLCLRRNIARPEVRVLCGEIVAALQNEILLVEGWLIDWFGMARSDRSSSQR